VLYAQRRDLSPKRLKSKNFSRDLDETKVKFGHISYLSLQLMLNFIWIYLLEHQTRWWRMAVLVRW